MSRNRVIGVDGGLPWKIPEDRRRFKDLTRNAVLVLGRRTLEEHPDLRHVSHASHVVVLSRTLREDELRPDQRGHTSSSSPPAPLLTLASSFEAALDAARRIVVEKKSLFKAEGKSDGGRNDAPDRLDCWVVGGERVYHEALLHPSAEQLHLTVVEMEVDDSNRGGSTQIARFPARYRWDNKFRLVSTASKTDEESSLAYRTDVFRRLKGRR
jgi:dihydrofolate reductase